jgi:hypothetical protein
MKSVAIRGSVVAAVASIFVLSSGIIAPAHAQQAALAANPELAAKGAWHPATTYVIDDLVTSRGSTWRSRRNNNTGQVPGQTSPTSTASFWELFARGFNPTGAWSSSATYHRDDLVTRGGQTWRAKRTISPPGAAPSAGADWELLAAKGAMGAQGEQGEQGPPGPNTGVPAGSTTAPGISFAGDSDTGIFSPAAGKIALVENGQIVFQNIGSENIGVGTNALGSVSSGGGMQNTALGDLALLNNTTGSANTAVGRNALWLNSSGAGNVAVGRQALGNNTTGSQNTAVGTNALLANTAGSHDNTAIGNSALLANTTSQRNTAVGSLSLSANQTGERNVGIGVRTLNTATAANDNVAVGDFALRFTTGGSNIAIGSSAGVNTTATTNSIFIGNPGVLGDDLTIKIGTQGTQTSAFMAGISGVPVGNAAVMIDSTTGQLGVGVAPSSRRFKHDIETMADMSALLTKLRPVTFRYNQAKSDGSHPLHYGLIAEEVAELMPDLAMFDKEGQPNGVQYHLLPPLLLAGYQAQQNTIAAQAEELRQQKAINAALEARLSRLEALLPQTKAAALQ